LGHPSKFQRVSRLAFVAAATSLTGSQPNFAQCLTVFLTGTLYIPFQGLLPPDGILRIYWQRYCTALQQRELAKLCGVVQGMEFTELSKRAPPIFGCRAAITLGIGPHSSSGCSQLLSCALTSH